MGSNLRCVTLCQLFNLSELQEMENENLKSTLRRRHTGQGYEGVKHIKQGDAHRVCGRASDAVSTQCPCSVYGHTGFLLFREPGGLSGVADFVSEASCRPGPARLGWAEAARGELGDRPQAGRVFLQGGQGEERGQKRGKRLPPLPTHGAPARLKPQTGPSHTLEPQTQSWLWYQPHLSTAI